MLVAKLRFIQFWDPFLLNVDLIDSLSGYQNSQMRSYQLIPKRKKDGVLSSFLRKSRLMIISTFFLLLHFFGKMEIVPPEIRYKMKSNLNRCSRNIINCSLNQGFQTHGPHAGVKGFNETSEPKKIEILFSMIFNAGGPQNFFKPRAATI